MYSNGIWSDPTIEHEEDEGEDCVCDKCFNKWITKYNPNYMGDEDD
jgi:hypothetical protein